MNKLFHAKFPTTYLYFDISENRLFCHLMTWLFININYNSVEEYTEMIVTSFLNVTLHNNGLLIIITTISGLRLNMDSWILVIQLLLQTALIQKSTIFWDIMPCSPLKVYWCFGGTCRHLLSCWFLVQLIFRPWRWRQHVALKRQLTFNRQHGVISQKIVLFITSTVRTSNPT
jgi:hypothetical protein